VQGSAEPPGIPGAWAAAQAPAATGEDLTTDAALDELYAAFADRLRLDLLRTYGTGEG